MLFVCRIEKVSSPPKTRASNRNQHTQRERIRFLSAEIKQPSRLTCKMSKYVCALNKKHTHTQFSLARKSCLACCCVGAKFSSSSIVLPVCVCVDRKNKRLLARLALASLGKRPSERVFLTCTQASAHFNAQHTQHTHIVSW